MADNIQRTLYFVALGLLIATYAIIIICKLNKIITILENGGP